MKLSSNTKKRIKNLIYWNFFRLLYFLGLAMLIPFIYILSFSSLGLHFVKVNLVIFLTALSLIALSSLGFYNISGKDKKKTYAALGSITLVPALMSIFFSFVSERVVINFIAKYVPGFVEQMVEGYLALVVPRLNALTGLYVVMGMVLLVMGYYAKR